MGADEAGAAGDEHAHRESLVAEQEPRPEPFGQSSPPFRMTTSWFQWKTGRPPARRVHPRACLRTFHSYVTAVARPSQEAPAAGAAQLAVGVALEQVRRLDPRRPHLELDLVRETLRHTYRCTDPCRRRFRRSSRSAPRTPRHHSGQLSVS